MSLNDEVRHTSGEPVRISQKHGDSSGVGLRPPHRKGEDQRPSVFPSGWQSPPPLCHPVLTTQSGLNLAADALSLAEIPPWTLRSLAHIGTKGGYDAIFVRRRIQVHPMRPKRADIIAVMGSLPQGAV